MPRPTPFQPRNTFSQNMILTMLNESPDFVSMTTLVKEIYGKDTYNHRAAFRSALMRLRERRPDLEITSVPGYRLRRVP